MLITEKLTISNTKRFLTTQNLFEILYSTFIKEVARHEKIEKQLFETTYNSNERRLTYSLRNVGESKYEACVIIMICNMIFDFLDWKPYIKTINYIAISKFILKKCRLSWSLFKYTKEKTVFNTVDHKIRVLYGLWEKGFYFEDLDAIPKAIRKLMNLELYGEYFLETLFKKDFQKNKMQYFSTSRKESSQYYNYYYYQDQGYQKIDTYDNMTLNENEYHQHQNEVLHTQFTIQMQTNSAANSTSSTANYTQDSLTSANTVYPSYTTTEGSTGRVTWTILTD